MSKPPDHNQQFEQVLSRLDALMRRGQPGESAAPFVPPPPPIVAPAQEDAEAARESDIPFVILEENNEIPVLTEVYDGSAPTSDNGLELAEAVVDALMPLMLENLDLIIAEEAARMQQNVAERLRIEIAQALRDRLLQKP